MKKPFTLFAAALAGAIACFLLILSLLTPESYAQVRRNLTLPAYWADSTGSNAFGLTTAAAIHMMQDGVLYTGVSATNVVVTNATGTRTLVFKNGVLTAVN